MVARKGQMFVAAVVFLTGLLFSVQQALLTYSLLDTSSPFQTKEHYVISDTLRVIESGIRDATDCYEFEGSLKELLAVLNEDYSAEGIVIEIGYTLDCSNWANQIPDEAPLVVSLDFTGIHHTSGLFSFYNVPGSSGACSNQNPSVLFSPTYRRAPNGRTGFFNVIVRNMDSLTCPASTFDLTSECPGSWTCAFSKAQLTMGPSRENVTRLNVTTPVGQGPGIFVINATARNSAAPAFSGKAGGIYEVG